MFAESRHSNTATPDPTVMARMSGHAAAGSRHNATINASPLVIAAVSRM
ncbi:MAG: hypothetical protein ACRDS0_20530 [Pseudonocardiaceae bacterium]